MAPNVTEAIFTSKNRINDLYPKMSNVKAFDLERAHLFYGRIDKQSDPVYLAEDKIKQIDSSTGTNFAVNFVSDAFQDLKYSLKRSASAGYYNSEIFPADMRIHRAWTNGNPTKAYEGHINKIYGNFIDEYLTIDRRLDKIANYKDFIKMFLSYCLDVCYNFPLTKAGFISSIHCSPFASGLMVEYAPEIHGIGHNAKIIKYINDPYYTFFVRHVKKYGFMVDKNAPWRLVFNIASGSPAQGTESATGAQRYMAKYGVTYENVFEEYYQKAYTQELANIKKVFRTLYFAFYAQFPTREVVDQYKNTSSRCLGNKYTSKRIDREPPPQLSDKEKEDFYFKGDSDEHWLKLILKLRLTETREQHDVQNFYFFSKQVVDNLRAFGATTAEKVINDLTKGFVATTFNTKGKYWHGLPDDVYERVSYWAKLRGDDPALVNYSLTGTKNTK